MSPSSACEIPFLSLYPPYFRFLLDTDHKQFGIECCGFASSGSHQLPEESAEEHCGIKGIAVPDRKMIVFDLTAALRVAEGRLME